MNERDKIISELRKGGFYFEIDTETFLVQDPKKFTRPEGYEDWEVRKYDTNAYFNERMELLGITPEENRIEIIGGTGVDANAKHTEMIFSPNKYGDIEILMYSLDRTPYTYMDKGNENTLSLNREQYDVMTRYCPWRQALQEDSGKKYHFTGKTGTHPFFHPLLIDLYEKKEKVPVLTVTEGFFKGFKATKEGIPTVAYSSISHFRDKKLNSLHKDMYEFIRVCEVEKLIILWDGDCLDISTSDIENQRDLKRRPYGFMNFALQIRDLAYKYINKKKLQVHFAHINSADISGEPKGIDDLLVMYPQKLPEIRSEFEGIGDSPGRFIQSLNISSDSDDKKMSRHFNLEKVSTFYSFHESKIKHHDFVFFGTTYKVEEGKPVIKIDANVKMYKRIGTQFYRMVMKPVPSADGKEEIIEEALDPWDKSSIIDDHGKNVITHIERFQGFTNIPSHMNYQQVVRGHWNLYYNVQHEIREEAFPHIELLIRHIFGEHYDYGLDYIKLLYERPFQKLPILCLVSKENQTGKSTFVYLMKLLFKHNMAIVSSEDLISPFNSQWVSKSLVACEETFLDKKQAMERIKSLSTAKTVMRNEKNKSAGEIPCALKFLFCSNNEDNFIQIDAESRRFWIRKVPVLSERIDNFDSKLEEEIPGFLHYLLSRDLSYEEKDRMWFKAEDLLTDAFHRVVRNSETSAIKELKSKLRDMFLDFGNNEIMMTTKDIREHFNMKRFEDYYLNKLITDELRVKKHLNEQGKQKVIRYYYPTWDLSEGDGKGVKKVACHGRPFVFKREQFVKSTEEVENGLDGKDSPQQSIDWN